MGDFTSIPWSNAIALDIPFINLWPMVINFVGTPCYESIFVDPGNDKYLNKLINIKMGPCVKNFSVKKADYYFTKGFYPLFFQDF